MPGKTSLINAGVIPLLKQWDECQILPIARMSADRFGAGEVANNYVFNTLMSWDQGQTDPAVLARLSLSEFKAKQLLASGRGRAG